MAKVVKEILYEKFQEESDPIQDMGIGGYSFETLKNGSILKCLKSFGTSHNGVMRSYNDAAKRAKRGDYILIFDIKKLDKYYISFRYKNFGSPLTWGNEEFYLEHDPPYLENAKRAREEYINNPISVKTKKYNDGYINKIGKNKFNKMFKIIERGTNMIGESLYERFSEDSDPIRDMGIGIRGFLEKELKIEGSTSSDVGSLKFFGTTKHPNEAFAIYIFLKNLLRYTSFSQETIDVAFIKTLGYEHPDGILKHRVNILKIKEALKKFYGIDVNY